MYNSLRLLIEFVLSALDIPHTRIILLSQFKWNSLVN
jgi:hypothetical protein